MPEPVPDPIEKVEAFSVLLLAGGHGTRLGQEKASAVVAGRPLLEWTARAVAALSDDLVVVRRSEQAFPAPAGLAWRETADLRPEAGPLAGIEAGLGAARHDVCVAVACDMPLVRPALVRALVQACAGVEVAMPVLEDRVYPVLAVYRRSCLGAVRTMLDAGESRPRVLLTRVPSRRVREAALREADAGLVSFTNVNYAADLARVEAALRADGVAGAEDARRGKKV